MSDNAPTHGAPARGSARASGDPPARPAVPPPRPMVDDGIEILSMREFADMCGVPPKTVETWFRRRETAVEVEPMPEPDDYVGQTAVWRLSRLTMWCEITGRPYNVDRWRGLKLSGAYRKPKKTWTPEERARASAAAKKAASSRTSTRR